MIAINRLRGLALVACALLVMPDSVDAHTRKGDKFLKLGQQAEGRKEWDKAIDYYDKAVGSIPTRSNSNFLGGCDSGGNVSGSC